MKTELKVQIVEALEKFLKDHAMSANEIAKKANVNSSYISNMRAGNFSVQAGANTVEIADKYFEILAEYIGKSIEKSYWELVATDQFTRVIATLEDARKYGYTNVIIGETGCGKSFAARVFAKNNPRDCFIITCGQSDKIQDTIDKVEEKILYSTPYSRSKKIGNIIKHMRALKMNGQNPILIFDEAEYLKHMSLCAMKELYDSLIGICAIVMIGTDQLTRNLDKMRKKNRDGIPQLYRRIKFGIRVLPTIDRSFKQFLNGVNDPALVRFLKENCDNYGELHDVLVPAKREADRTGNPLTENFVRTIFNMPKI